MRLTELDPRFVKYETRDGREFIIRTNSLADAEGIMFLCPACFQKNGGARGTHAIEVTFRDRNVPDHKGSHGSNGAPTRWQASGTGLDDLTTRPSILIDGPCAWHGFITNGDVA